MKKTTRGVRRRRRRRRRARATTTRRRRRSAIASRSASSSSSTSRDGVREKARRRRQHVVEYNTEFTKMKKEAKKARRERFPKHEMTKNLRLFFGERGRASLKGEREGSFSSSPFEIFFFGREREEFSREKKLKKGKRKEKEGKKRRESSLFFTLTRAQVQYLFLCTHRRTRINK